jgi:acyl-CoA synthetase (AMP-forming)/AMP-acid ligase II
MQNAVYVCAMVYVVLYKIGFQIFSTKKHDFTIVQLNLQPPMSKKGVSMAAWLNLGQNLKVNAKKFPNTVALKDSMRSYTYPEVNKRVNKLAHSLLSSGLKKGDKVAVLLENSIEIVEIFLATAKTGIVIVPINFRLISPEVEYIADNSDAKAFIVHHEFTSTLDPIKAKLKNIEPDKYIVVGKHTDGYQPYEQYIEN